MGSEATHLLVLSEHQGAEWARRLWGLGERPTVCGGLGEALRALTIRRHQVFLIDLPVAGHTRSSLTEYLAAHPLSQGMRFILASAKAERHPPRLPDDERLWGLTLPCSDSQLQLALAVNGEPLDPSSPESEPLWDSTYCEPSQAAATWDHDAIAAQWEHTGSTGLRAKAAALVTLCTSLCQLPVEREQAVQALYYLAPRIRAVVRRARMPPPRNGAPRKPGRLPVERVAHGWADLLDHVLKGIDRTASGGAETTATRLWIVLQAMRIYRASVILEVLWGVPRQRGLWLRLHELRTYAAVRIRPQVDAEVDAQLVAAGNAIEHSYLEALILGCALIHPPPQLIASRLSGALSEWARQAQLRQAVRKDWRRGWWVLDPFCDGPPSYLDGALPDAWHGYQLELPTVCHTFLGTLKHD